MKNGLLLAGLLLALLSVAGMMWVKTDVQTLTRVRQQLADERLTLKEHKRVLEAEYALLASPARLKALAARDGYVSADPLMVQPMSLPKVVVRVTPTVAAVRVQDIVWDTSAAVPVRGAPAL